NSSIGKYSTASGYGKGKTKSSDGRTDGDRIFGDFHHFGGCSGIRTDIISPGFRGRYAETVCDGGGRDSIDESAGRVHTHTLARFPYRKIGRSEADQFFQPVLVVV